MTDVAFVVPAYRPRRAWLQQAIDSILHQAGCRPEVVVVDDGSPEPVEDILGSSDSRVRVLRVSHGGVSRARDAGTAATSAPYVRFVDADDAIPSDSTARLLAHAAGRRDVIAYGATLMCDERLRPVWRMRTRVQGDARRSCLLGLFATRLGGLLFPRPVLDAVGPWNDSLTVAEDWDFVLRTLEFATVCGDGVPVLWYRRHSESATADIAAGARAGRAILEAYFERHPEQRGSPLERRAWARLDAADARVLATHGRWRAATPSLRRALVSAPGAVVAEIVRTPPVLLGRVRHRLRPARPLGEPL